MRHLSAPLGAGVTVRREIEAHMQGGVLDHALRAVPEKLRTLRFKTAQFE